MKSLNRDSLIVLYAYLLLFAAGLTMQLSISQSEISIGVNQHHFPLADLVLQYLTYLGDGIFVVLLGLVMMLKDRKAGLAILLAYAVSALITQALKHWVFDDMNRPSLLLQELNLYFVEGVEIHRYNSFPSGHSTSAFAAGTMLCLLFRKTGFRLLMLGLVLLVCFSRIYLLQHFFQDTLAGSLIGFVTTFFTYLILYRNDQS